MKLQKSKLKNQNSDQVQNFNFQASTDFQVDQMSTNLLLYEMSALLLSIQPYSVYLQGERWANFCTEVAEQICKM